MDFQIYNSAELNDIGSFTHSDNNKDMPKFTAEFIIDLFRNDIFDQLQKILKTEIILAAPTGSKIMGLSQRKCSDVDISVYVKGKKGRYLAQSNEILSLCIDVVVTDFNELEIYNQSLIEETRYTYPSMCNRIKIKPKNIEKLSMPYDDSNLYEIINTLSSGVLLFGSERKKEWVDKLCADYYAIDFLDMNLTRIWGNYINYCNEKKCMVRKYLRTLHHIFFSKWIYNNNYLPPLNFYELFKEQKLTVDVKCEINKLLKINAESVLPKENVVCDSNIIINRYIKGCIEELKESIFTYSKEMKVADLINNMPEVRVPKVIFKNEKIEEI